MDLMKDYNFNGTCIVVSTNAMNHTYYSPSHGHYSSQGAMDSDMDLRLTLAIGDIRLVLFSA